MPRAFPDGSRHGLTPGDVFGDRYALRELIGEGGMGRVFRAEQRSLGRSVAVKFLRSNMAHDGDMLRRFHTEVRAASMLSHPNLVAVIDFGVVVPDGPFLVMEYVRGSSLTRILHREGPLPLRRAARLLDQILSALDAAHRGGVVHADVKSDNILVERDQGDEEERVKVIDFGLARMRRSVELDSAPDHTLSGTPEYLAPEVIRGEVPAAAADLYAAGIILFELLTGTTPFGGGTAAEILERHLTEAVMPPSLRRPDRLIPPALEQVVVRALEKNPAARFHGAAAFRAALAQATERMDVNAIGRCQSCDQQRPVEICFCPLCGSSTGDRDSTASTRETTTHNWGPPQQPVAARRERDRRSPPPRPHLSHSVDPGLRVLYRAISRAMERGATSEITDAYLELARALVRSGRIIVAIAEVQEGIDVVSAGRAVEATEPAPSLSRLFAGLAGLHGLAGQHGGARRAAILSHRLARRHR